MSVDREGPRVPAEAPAKAGPRGLIPGSPGRKMPSFRPRGGSFEKGAGACYGASMSVSFLVLLGVVIGVLGLCFVGIGVGIFFARKKRLGACSCDFDPAKERANAAARAAGGGCCGGGGGECGCSHEPTVATPAAAPVRPSAGGCCGGEGGCGCRDGG